MLAVRNRSPNVPVVSWSPPSPLSLTPHPSPPCLRASQRALASRECHFHPVHPAPSSFSYPPPSLTLLLQMRRRSSHTPRSLRDQDVRCCSFRRAALLLAVTSLPPQTKKTHKVEADVGTLRQIATRLKTALQDGSWFHMRRCSHKLQRAHGAAAAHVDVGSLGMRGKLPLLLPASVRCIPSPSGSPVTAPPPIVKPDHVAARGRSVHQVKIYCAAAPPRGGVAGCAFWETGCGGGGGMRMPEPQRRCWGGRPADEEGADV